jgi:DNA-directed RNA polymerase specialized sigma24 family protein
VPVESVPEPAAAAPAVPAVDGEPELWAAVRDLPPKQRTAVFCRTVLGMPYEELAELLESTEDAARHNVSEGLKKLREEWTA